MSHGPTPNRTTYAALPIDDPDFDPFQDDPYPGTEETVDASDTLSLGSRVSRDEHRLKTCWEALKVLVTSPIAVLKGTLEMDNGDSACAMIATGTCCTIMTGLILSYITTLICSAQNQNFNPCDAAKVLDCNPLDCTSIISCTGLCPETTEMPKCNSSQFATIREEEQAAYIPYSNAQLWAISASGLTVPALGCLVATGVFLSRACRTIGEIRQQNERERVQAEAAAINLDAEV